MKWTLAFCLLLASATADATGDLLTFDVEDPGYDFELMMVGREDPGAPQVRMNAHDGRTFAPIALRATDRVVMDRSRRTFHMRFTNPGDPALPPSFDLRIRDGRGVLVIEGRTLTGHAGWDH